MKRLSRAQRAYLLDHLRQSGDPKLIEIATKLNRSAGRQKLTDGQETMRRLWAHLGKSLVRREMQLGHSKSEAVENVASNLLTGPISADTLEARIARHGRKKKSNK